MTVSRRSLLSGAASFVALAQLARPAGAQGAPEVLFAGAQVFDGIQDSLIGPLNVLVRGNLIAEISPDPIDPPAGATVIDATGKTLMPGLIDAHTHLMMTVLTVPQLMTSDASYVTLRAGASATAQLMRGFTSSRDLGGPVFGLKRAIDDGVIAGPRIWPSGALISQTSGHGDFRSLQDLPRDPAAPLHFTEVEGFAAIADGVDEVLRATREQLFRGASQIKLMAGGGVSSDHDPIDSVQYTAPELRAAVEAAAGWGTYVAVHAYTPPAIKQAIDVGVLCIDHGQLADEDSAALMAEKGIWWSLQPFLDDEDATPFPPNSSNRVDQMKVLSGTYRAYELAIRYGIKTAFGTDTLFDPRLATRQGAQLAKLTRWYTPAETLRMATSGNAALLGLSGARNPYPGQLGVVATGALADLLLVDGNPLADLALIADPENRFKVIMKDGVIYKNTL